VITEARTPSQGCPATTAREQWTRGTLHGATVTTYERWTRSGSPHRVPHGVHLVAGASLEVEPCAVLLFGAGTDLVVQNDARLRAEGTQNAPILFGSLASTPSPGDWIGVELRTATLPGTALSHVRIEHAGAEPVARNDPPAALRSWQRMGLLARDVTVSDSGAWGVSIMGAQGFHREARALRVLRSQEGAVRIADVEAVATLPSADLRGNTRDEVFIAATQRTLRRSATWRNPGPGVRYRVRNDARILVQGPEAPTLTLAAGTTLAFDEAAELAVGVDDVGSLVARGSETEGAVVFTSSHVPLTPASWVGLRFGPHAEISHIRLDLVRIEGAGASSEASMGACAVLGQQRTEIAGMVVFQGTLAQSVITRTHFVAGPPRGVGVLIVGDFLQQFPSFAEEALDNDWSAAGVLCTQNEASRNGRCIVTARCR
jgi:hypothetical protein